MARLNLLPLEIEEGRWQGIPRAERLCRFGCGVVGDLHHFLNGCAALTTANIQSLNRYSVEADVNGSLLTFWRSKARELECRWRERVQKLRRLQTEPENPADAHDDETYQDVDEIVKRHSSN